MAIELKLVRVARSLAGLLVGALFSTSVALPFTGLVHSSPDPDLNEGYGSLVVVGTIMVAMFAIPLGLAGHAVLYALKQRSLAVYAIVGSAFGMVFAVLTDTNGGPDFGKNLLMYSLWAGSCAAIAWLIRRPDKDATLALDTHF